MLAYSNCKHYFNDYVIGKAQTAKIFFVGIIFLLCLFSCVDAVC